MVGRPYTCPYCSSTNTVWKGYRKRNKDRVRLRRCRECMRRFTTRVVEPNEESPTPEPESTEAESTQPDPVETESTKPESTETEPIETEMIVAADDFEQKVDGQ